MADNIHSLVVKDVLLRQSYVSESDLAQAEKYAQANHSSIEEYLLANSLITKDLLGQATAEALQVPYADLNSNQPSKEQVLKIPEVVAKKFRVVLFKEEATGIIITTDKPQATGLLDEIKKIFPNKKISVHYSVTEDVDTAFIHYRKALQTRFADILKSQTRVAPEILEEIFTDAVAYRASDIHFEPQEKEVLIRFRIDGVLHEAGRLAKDYYENILNRIKVQARLRIDEHYAMQDGAIRYAKTGMAPVDMRVSLAPTLDGEKVVIRLLSEYVRSLTLSDLGLSETNQKLLLEAADKPFGMILVTGPTGSGKTTTLYALLKILNRSDVNITTIEDPVEYKIVGINQIQVNPATSITFAKGLRSIVRQDPDIILVGEIRDQETAEISVNAALTGHLMLSTFHANDAATAVPRLLDMGVEPFLMASTLNIIIAQRLVRRICESCRASQSYKLEEVNNKFPAAIGSLTGPEITLYYGKGCSVCNNEGYRGRIAIYEFIPVSRELKELILTNPSTQQIWDLVSKRGARSMYEDGLAKVKAGETTLDELLRVTSPPSAG